MYPKSQKLIKMLLILQCSKNNLKINIHLTYLKKKQNKLKSKKILTSHWWPSPPPGGHHGHDGYGDHPDHHAKTMLYGGALPIGVSPSMAGEAFNWKEKENDINQSKVKFINICICYCFKFIKPVELFPLFQNLPILIKTIQQRQL